MCVLSYIAWSIEEMCINNTLSFYVLHASKNYNLFRISRLHFGSAFLRVSKSIGPRISWKWFASTNTHLDPWRLWWRGGSHSRWCPRRQWRISTSQSSCACKSRPRSASCFCRIGLPGNKRKLRSSSTCHLKGRGRTRGGAFFADARANDANVASVISNEHGTDDVRLIYARIVLYRNGLKVPIDSVRGTSRGMWFMLLHICERKVNLTWKPCVLEILDIIDILILDL